MTTTSLKHIVSNVENIRNPVITHCYYGNLLLLSGLCFPSVLCAFIFVPFFCNRCLFLVFTTHISFSIFYQLSHLSCASFCIPSFRSSSLSAFHLFSKQLSWIRSMVCGRFPHPVFSLRSFLYPHFSVISSSWYAILDT